MKLIKKIDQKNEKKLKETIFIGKLADDLDLFKVPINKAVDFPNASRDHMHLYIKCLSTIPEEIKDCFYYGNEIITASTRSTNNQKKLEEMVPGLFKLFHHEKIKKVTEALKQKLLMFYLTSSNEYLYVELINFAEVDAFSDEYTLIPSPRIEESKNDEDFKQRLVDGNRTIVLPNYPDFLPEPEFIFNDGWVYQSFALNKGEAPTTYTQRSQQAENIERTYIGDKFYSFIEMSYEDSIHFISLENNFELRDELEQSKQNLIFDNVENIDNEFKESEHSFLKQLERNAYASQLYYSTQDFYNFHVSLKTNLLTIIGGMAGTGKSQLALLYGKTLGLQLGFNMKMVPISPIYHEPNDILGFLHPTTNIYYESDTEIVSLLIEAEKNKDHLYMVIFDEMNLSQVEHWFSPFISLLELRPEERVLNLFNTKTNSINGYPSSITIGNNVIFVGTVNFDETTKMFSDRLLDRSNVIIPTKLSFSESLRLAEENPYSLEENFESYSIRTSAFRDEWIKEHHLLIKSLTREELEFLDEVNEILQLIDHQKGVSFRVALSIGRFLSNIPVNENGEGVIERKKAFDIQLKQRVLTKISGMDMSIEEVVGSYHKNEYKMGVLAELLMSERGERISEFTLSMRMLQNKAKELMTNGFAR